MSKLSRVSCLFALAAIVLGLSTGAAMAKDEKKDQMPNLWGIACADAKNKATCCLNLLQLCLIQCSKSYEGKPDAIKIRNDECHAKHARCGTYVKPAASQAPSTGTKAQDPAPVGPGSSGLQIDLEPKGRYQTR